MRCLIGLGSNDGDRTAILAQAERALAALPDTRVLVRSRTITTQPIGGPAGQGAFLNAAITIETSLSATALLAELQQIEHHAGRQRVVRWGTRTLDLDLLLYGTEIIDQPGLQVPHPRMIFRRFVLEPAAEIAGDWLHPTSGWTVARLWQHVQSAPRLLVVVTSAPEDFRQMLDGVRSRLTVEMVADWTIAVVDRDDLLSLEDLTNGGTISPRLIVVWEPSAVGDASRFRSESCPVFRLDGVDASTAIDELVAAIQAMDE